MLSTAELLLGLSRHLSAYGTSQPRADLGQLEFAGQVLDTAVRLRGSGVCAPERVEALARGTGITKRALRNDILPTLEVLGLVDLEHNVERAIIAVSERVPPVDELFASADRLVDIAAPEPLERMALAVLRETTLMPITQRTALELCAGLGSEEDALEAIEDLQSLHLCMRRHSADDNVVLFNPNVWAADHDYSAAALRAEDGDVRAALTGLLEEVSASAGLPELRVTSCEKKWVDYAVAQGLLQRSIVTTTDGVERAFLFAPHMGKAAFEAPTGVDPSGHVRQLIGSMVFARTYATNRLFAPTKFLNRLINDGEAGDATNIGTDYPMLETAGIVRVEKAPRFFKFVLLQADVAQEALTYLDNAGSSSLTAGLRGQRSYRHPERERAAALAVETEPSPRATANIIAALRQEIGARRYAG